MIKYLRSLGFNATNDIFAENAWYFRNALVRANYTDLTHGIRETTVYLEAFLRNLLLGEKNELKNRYLHINSSIEPQKPAINSEKPAIEPRIAGFKMNIKTKTNIGKLYNNFGTLAVFGRSDVSEICGISYSAAGDLIAKIKKHGLLEDVKGHGKGKYRFVK